MFEWIGSWRRRVEKMRWSAEDEQHVRASTQAIWWLWKKSIEARSWEEKGHMGRMRRDGVSTILTAADMT